MPDERIVAVALLTKSDIERLGEGFARYYPVDATPCFGDLLRAIDEADRALRAEAAPNARPR